MKPYKIHSRKRWKAISATAGHGQPAKNRIEVAASTIRKAPIKLAQS